MYVCALPKVFKNNTLSQCFNELQSSRQNTVGKTTAEKFHCEQMFIHCV